MTEINYIDMQMDVYEKKNRDYGNSFYKSIEKYGVVAYYVRAEDKLNRLTKLINTKEQAVTDESVADTVNDLFNYTAMFLSKCMTKKGEVSSTLVRANMQFLLDVGFADFLVGINMLEEGTFTHSFINEFLVFN